MINLQGVLEQICYFFGGARKRRAPDTVENCTSPKHMRIDHSMSVPRHFSNNDWLGNTNIATFKKSSLSKISSRASTKQPRIIDTVILDDDDDDIIEVKKSQSRSKFMNHTKSTSTPLERSRLYTNGNIENGDDDDEVSFVKEIKSQKEKQDEAKKSGYNYIKPSTGKFFNIGSDSQNGTKLKERKITNSIGAKNKTPKHSNLTKSSLDFSFRLDDKMQYRKLLESAGFNTPPNVSPASFHTPCGKLFEYDTSNRAGRMVAMATKSPDSTINSSRERKSTKDTIIKVLDDFEADTVVVKDSDSEKDVIFVSPPSPKPDIKVEPINSLKKVIDTSKPTNPEWLQDLVDRHKKNVETREREIQALREYGEKYNSINRVIGIEKLRRDLKSCLQLKDYVLPVEDKAEEELPELTNEQLQMINRIYKGDPNEVLARKFNLNITRRDLQTLAGLNWLNDEVINFYMNLIIERGKEKYAKSYAFNTFFYLKLIKDGPNSLRRWTKRIDLFSYDLICVPIHLGMHWCMAIIDLREKYIRYYDSMGSPNNRCLEALRNYLEAEHLDKKNTEYNTDDFVVENVKDIPQQMNGSDCGMFACTFAEFITRGAKITFNQQDMQYLRKKMVVEIMTGELLIK